MAEEHQLWRKDIYMFCISLGKHIETTAGIRARQTRLVPRGRQGDTRGVDVNVIRGANASL